MFVGEMGCWLFVGAYSLYSRYLARQPKPEENGYEAVDTYEGEAVDNDEASITSASTLKPSALNVEKERIPLLGWRVLLLALPAICDICGTTLSE